MPERFRRTPIVRSRTGGMARPLPDRTIPDGTRKAESLICRKNQVILTAKNRASKNAA